MRVFRFLKALLKYLFIGNKVSFEEYSDRIATCSDCESRCGRNCCECGCLLVKKAKWSTESCPKNKW